MIRYINKIIKVTCNLSFLLLRLLYGGCKYVKAKINKHVIKIGLTIYVNVFEDKGIIKIFFKKQYKIKIVINIKIILFFLCIYILPIELVTVILNIFFFDDTCKPKVVLPDGESAPLYDILVNVTVLFKRL